MSFDPPSLQAFQSFFQSALEQLKHKQPHSSTEQTTEIAKQCFSILEEDSEKLELFRSSFDPEKFSKYHRSKTISFNKILQSCVQDSHQNELEDFIQCAISAHEMLLSFFYMELHREELSSGIEPFLEYSWAKTIFIHFYEQEVECIVNLANQLFLENPTFLFKLIILGAKNGNKNEKLLIKLLEETQISDEVTKLFSTDSMGIESIQMQERLLCALQKLSTRSKQKYSLLLLEIQKQQHHIGITRFLVPLIILYEGYEELVEKLFHELRSASYGHLELLGEVFIVEEGKPMEASLFLNQFNKKLTQPNYTPCLLSAYCYLEFPVVFKKQIEEVISKVTDSSTFEEKVYVLLERRAKFHYTFLINLPGYVTSTPPYIRFFCLKELLKRDRNLIFFFTDRLDKDVYRDFLHTDNFQSYTHLILGYDESHTELTNYLLNALKEYETPTISITPEKHALENTSKTLSTKAPQTFWIRDAFFAKEGSITVSPPVNYSQELLETIKMKRTQRAGKRNPEISDKPYFTSMGKTFCENSGIFILSSLMQLFENHHNERSVFQFVANEGGNVLSGKDYAVVGLDSLEYAKENFKLELPRLGLTKNDRNEWRISLNDKLTPSEPSEEEFEGLFRLDLGCQKVFFVEQADYHLDTFCFIKDIDKKIVWINDSAMAFAKDKELLNQRCRESIDRDPGESVLSQRAHLYESHCKDLKKYEDLTASDFIRHGFKVERKAGKRLELDLGDVRLATSNLFNKFCFQTPSGKKVAIFLSSCPEIQREFQNELSEAFEEDVEFVFLPEKFSRELQYGYAGVRCMMQGLNL